MISGVLPSASPNTARPGNRRGRIQHHDMPTHQRVEKPAGAARCCLRVGMLAGDACRNTGRPVPGVIMVSVPLLRLTAPGEESPYR